jgi:hypothetical protein
MGLRDWLRRKPDADPILGDRAQPVAAVEAVAGTDPVEIAALAQTLLGSGGPPEAFADELRRLFPDAQITVANSETIGAGGSPAAGDPVSALERLAELHASGALTDEEFALAKARLLGG